MEKQNLAWLFVRAFGIYFAAQAFSDIYYISMQIFMLVQLQDIATFKEGIENHLLRKWIEIGIMGAQMIVFIFLSYYCFFKGKFIHKLLMYRGNSEKT